MLKLEPRDFIDTRLILDALNAAMCVIDPKDNPDEIFKICKALKNINLVHSAINKGEQMFNAAYVKTDIKGRSETVLEIAEEHKQRAINSVLDPDGVLEAHHELISNALKPGSF